MLLPIATNGKIILYVLLYLLTYLFILDNKDSKLVKPVINALSNNTENKDACLNGCTILNNLLNGNSK